MKYILIRADFYRSIVLKADEVFINAFKRLENCKEILDEIKKDSIEAYVNGYDQYKLEYRISHNLFWHIRTTPQTLQKIFPVVDLSLPVVEVTDQHGWEERIREFIDPKVFDINNHVGVTPNKNLLISIDSDNRVILSDSEYPGHNPIYIKNVNISMLRDVLKT